MRLVKDYMNNDTMRHALNELTEKTFGFNFESWVTFLSCFARYVADSAFHIRQF